jgi:uncharacterized protein YfaS (alpha-2-macroglobulin family)
MKKYIALSAVAIAVVAFTGSVALANYGTDNKLSGKVREYRTTKSIKNAKVSLYTTKGSKKDSDKTKKDGRYSFKDLSEKNYVVKVKASDYRNPKNSKKDSISYTVKVDGTTSKNLYLKKEK